MHAEQILAVILLSCFVGWLLFTLGVQVGRADERARNLRRTYARLVRDVKAGTPKPW